MHMNGKDEIEIVSEATHLGQLTTFEIRTKKELIGGLQKHGTNIGYVRRYSKVHSRTIRKAKFST